MQIVEDDDVDAPFVDALIGLHVGLDRSAGKERPLGALDGHAHLSEDRDLLWLAVFEQLKIALGESGDELPCASSTRASTST